MSECAPQLHSRGKQKVKKKKKKIKVRSLLFPITQASAALHSYLADRLPASRQGIPGQKWGALERVIVCPVQFSADDWKDQRGSVT